METLLTSIFSYLISLAANEHTDQVHKHREKKLSSKLKRSNALSRALESSRGLKDEVVRACIRLAQDKDTLGLSSVEQVLWNLLVSDEFQGELYEWLMAGGLPEGEDAKIKLLEKITNSLKYAGVADSRIFFVKNHFFEQLEKAAFSNEILARWRHQRGLDYLREQVSSLRVRADEAAGIFDVKKQNQALSLYCEQAFKTWDIIDLTNLPEGDVDVATQNLLVRQLYMPLRIAIEEDPAEINKLEEKRDIRRRIEAGYLDEQHRPENSERKAGIGEWLQESSRIVVLGDPGGGKTTMLRWLATAMLLRYRKDPTLDQLPDVSTLPTHQWIPVLIRCRDLGEADLCRCFSDFLDQHFHKTTLTPEHAKVMQSLILEKISSNQVLLMIDGLDEITNPEVRVRFCQEIERTAVRYPQAPIIVTSRIVGYRDMPYRLGSDFLHGVISELDRDHKDLFAKRWIEVTNQRVPIEEKAKRERELIEALHASDRVERLTGNPMLLTTLALVKRKVGKLPSRRNKLYAEAVAVLLNWNPNFYETIEESEAIPQLEYLAFEMCRQGVQRLTDDEIMDLLEQFRREYPSIRAVRNHSEREFLALLEARSSILIRSGSVWKKGYKKEQAAWEFRHLTFQEYLAAQALLDGRYPNRDKTLSLAMQVAPLAGIVRNRERIFGSHKVNSEVPESWREALRLLVADCKDDDVDEVLIAILNPGVEENQDITRRTRAVLAGLCLADEPNASEKIAQIILSELSDVILDEDGYAHYQTPLAIALTELHRSEWHSELKTELIARYISNDDLSNNKYGSIWGYISTIDWGKLTADEKGIVDKIVSDLSSGAARITIPAALTLMNAAYDGKIAPQEKLIEPLFSLLSGTPAEKSSAVWALGWLTKKGIKTDSGEDYRFTPDQVDFLCHTLVTSPQDAINSQYWLCYIVSLEGGKNTAEVVVKFLDSPYKRVVLSALDALARIKNASVAEEIYKKVTSTELDIQVCAARALGLLHDIRGLQILTEKWRTKSEAPGLDSAILEVESDEINRALLSEDMDSIYPLIQDTEITEARVLQCATELKIHAPNVRERYEKLAMVYPLTITWDTQISNQ